LDAAGHFWGRLARRSERLGYGEDAALKRVRVARLAERVPRGTTAPLPLDASSGPRVACPGAPGAGRSESRGRVQPLSAATYRVELTVSAMLRDKIERARELVSHSVPGGECWNGRSMR
jgi:hypothetical protein